jgi:predicted phosphodiesterase
MIAVISDIHSNLAAFLAVLAEIDSADIVYCAGDIVGYGPNPNECCALVQDRNIRAVLGNHDFVCANLDRMNDPDGGMSEEDMELCRRMFEQKNTAAQAASLWTNRVLTAESREFLRSLPTEIDEHGLTMVHGKPGSKSDRLNEYMLPGEMQDYDPDSVHGNMLVVGHSHIPIRTASVVNPGSVGQPRDRDWRASFLILKDAWYRFSYIKDADMSFRIVSQLVRMRRVPYDVRSTIERIKAEPDLPDTLGDRLTVGL